MARSTQYKRLPSNFAVGGEVAETDPLLQRAFYASGHYAAVESAADPRCFLIGRTGSGKSAVLQHLEENQSDHVIRINPEDLSLTYVADLGVIRHLASMDVHLDPLFIALWKHVLLIEIIRHRYNVDSPDAKTNFLTMLKERIKRDKSKLAALEYLDEFDGRFWCETDERIRQITKKFEQEVQAEARSTIGGRYGSLKGGANSSATTGFEERAEQADRYQRLVNETQLPRLNKMINVLNEDILDSPQNFTYVVVDDLDRDWVDEKVANDLIRCLFRAVLDMKRVRNLKIVVALRTNIFDQLDFGGRTGGQEEKFRALTLRMRWNRGDLEMLLNERARAASERPDFPRVDSMRELIPPTNRTRGNAMEYIFSRTLMRPRDAIAFFNEAFVLAAGKTRLSWDHLQAAEQPYSRKRLLALRDEWKPTFPDIDRVFQLFSECSVILTPRELREILDDAMLLPAERDFEGVRWMTSVSDAFWNGSDASEWIELYHPLIALLFNVGFIGCVKGPSKREIFAYDDPDFVVQISNLRATEGFTVHPAFRGALDITHQAYGVDR